MERKGSEIETLRRHVVTIWAFVYDVTAVTVFHRAYPQNLADASLSSHKGALGPAQSHKARGFLFWAVQWRNA